MADSKKIDVIVFGATGDAGRCCCHFFHNKGALVGVKSWAPAARNLEKLSKSLGDVGSGKGEKPADGILASTAVKADSGDYASVLAMAKQAKVIVACAGPFADYGENVVKACVEAGTDYVDITGETPWVNLMAKKYGEQAAAKGISVLSQAAYDSVPSDITVALAAKVLKDNGEQLVAAETHHKLGGGALPVGTLNTLIAGILMARRKMLALVTMGAVGGPTAEEKAKKESEKEQRAALKGKSGLVPKTAENTISSDFRANMLNPYSALAGTFSIPGFMAMVNTPIVHTTAHALGYGVDQGRGFTYRERLGANDATIASLYGFLPFAIIMIGFALGGFLAFPFVLPLIVFFPQALTNGMRALNNSDPGGAKKKAFAKLFNGFLPNGLTAVLAIASSSSGKATARVTFVSKYDAGLGFTALSACTVAAAILEKRAKGEKGKGFETAVVGVGPEMLQEWYEKAGVKINATVSKL